MRNIQVHQLLALTFFALIVGAYALMAMFYPVAYIWATYEDLFGEWGQTYFFATALLFSVLVAFTRSRYRIVFGLLAVALFYVVMEEISWGQRIFGFESPDFFRRNNLQRETNLHNMLVGPFSTGLKDFIEYALAVALVTYGLAYPLLLRLGWGPARWFSRMGIPSPPLYLWPFFLLAGWLEIAPFSFNEAELAEILVGFALALTAAQYWFVERRGLPAHAPPAWAPEESRRFALLIAAVTLLVAGLATATTYTFYNSPEKRRSVDARLLNGYEKFAGRYERYDNWHVAASLYLAVHEREPGRTSILRRLATAYRMAGEEDKFDLYTRKALDISLAEYARDPDKISTNLALSRTYRLLGEDLKAGQHAQRAHEIALQRADRKPQSANAAYWLGKTYRHLGDYSAARDQFKKAFDINPASKKYRKAYFEMRRAVGG